MPKAAPLSAAPANARQALEQRVAVLASLGAGALKGSSPLGSSLQAGWERERTLIQRLLDDTAEQARVLATLDRWEERTTAFQARQGRPDARWTDRQGQDWQADQVLALLADLRDRLSSWREKDGPAPGADAGAPAHTPSSEALAAPATEPHRQGASNAAPRRTR